MPDLREQLEQCCRGRVCLVGVGNADGGDDGFGVRLAETLRARSEARTPKSEGIPKSESRFRHLVAAEVTRLKLQGKQSLLTSAPTVSKSAPETGNCSAVLADSDFGLRSSFEFRPSEFGFEILFAGTAPERCLGRITAAGFDHVIFLDAVEFGGEPGSVVFLGAGEMAARFPQISTHKISLGTLAKWIEASGTTRAWLLGVQPASLKAEENLSPAVQTSLNLVVELLAGQFDAPAGAGALKVRRCASPGQAGLRAPPWEEWCEEGTHPDRVQVKHEPDASSPAPFQGALGNLLPVTQGDADACPGLKHQRPVGAHGIAESAIRVSDSGFERSDLHTP